MSHRRRSPSLNSTTWHILSRYFRRRCNRTFAIIDHDTVVRYVNCPTVSVFPPPEHPKAIFVIFYKEQPLLTYYPNGDIQANTPKDMNILVVNSYNYSLPLFPMGMIKIQSINKVPHVMYHDADCARSRTLHNPNAATYGDWVKLFPLQDGMVFNEAWTRQMYMSRQLHNMLCELSPSFTRSMDKIQPRRIHGGHYAGDFCPVF